ARRHYMGKSLIDKDDFSQANEVWQNLINDPKRNLYLPTDLVLSLSIEKAEDVQEVEVGELLQPNFEDYAATDIGPKTIEKYISVIRDSKTVFWNGNMGVSEIDEFANGTVDIARALKDLSQNENVKIVIGGGDTVTAVETIMNRPLAGGESNIFLSTGGGATLEYLAGKVLPGLKALE
ncbi:MAG: phosphoglycerate kinase, partial [Candidatus Berkelbacteria bacterium]